MSTSSSAKTMLAEEDALIAMSIREVLSLLGYEVVGVAANEGASILRTILDIPVVFFTAQADPGTRARAAAVQPSAYLCKPASPQQIVSAVEEALRETRKPPAELKWRSQY